MDVLASPCVRGEGTSNGAGYLRRTGVYAHRAAYERAIGPIPAGLVIDHLCRNPWCANPEHLEAVTNRENSRRGLRGRLVVACPNGHPYDPANTLYRANGHRRCRTCHHDREHARYHARRIR